MSDARDRILTAWKKFSATIQIENEFDLKSLENYLSFLENQNERGGFFSKKDSEQIVERHLLESAYFVLTLKNKGLVSRETRVADVGTGPGLPGFLFACLNEPVRVTLVDSQKRKLAILEECLQEILPEKISKNVAFSYERAEDTKLHFDLVTSRAMVPYPWSVEVVSRMVHVGGYYCPFHGTALPPEDKEKEILKRTGFKLQEIVELDDLDFLGKRHIRVLKKLRLADKGTPRSWKDIQKEIQANHGKDHSDQ